MEEFKELSDEELENVTGGRNWAKYGLCLLSHGATAVPELAEIVAAVNAKDWDKVKRLSLQAALSSNSLVAECLACS